MVLTAIDDNPDRRQIRDYGGLLILPTAKQPEHSPREVFNLGPMEPIPHLPLTHFPDGGNAEMGPGLFGLALVILVNPTFDGV